MSEAIPGECRSHDCENNALYFASLVIPTYKPPSERRARQWSGEFCDKHLVRAISRKLRELRGGEQLTIERLYRT